MRGGLPRGRGTGVVVAWASACLNNLFHCDGCAGGASTGGDAETGADGGAAEDAVTAGGAAAAVGSSGAGAEAAADDRVTRGTTGGAEVLGTESKGGAGDADVGGDTVGAAGRGGEGSGETMVTSSIAGKSVDLSVGSRRWMDSLSCASNVTSADVITLQ